MDMNWFRGAMTVIWLLIFIGVVWWAYSPRRKARFDDAARLVFDEQSASDKSTDSREP
jgi:cytochrome c oxidase cbb3-type subunit IV